MPTYKDVPEIYPENGGALRRLEAFIEEAQERTKFLGLIGDSTSTSLAGDSGSEYYLTLEAEIARRVGRRTHTTWATNGSALPCGLGMFQLKVDGISGNPTHWAANNYIPRMEFISGTGAARLLSSGSYGQGFCVDPMAIHAPPEAGLARGGPYDGLWFPWDGDGVVARMLGAPLPAGSTSVAWKWGPHDERYMDAAIMLLAFQSGTMATPGLNGSTFAPVIYETPALGINGKQRGSIKWRGVDADGGETTGALSVCTAIRHATKVGGITLVPMSKGGYRTEDSPSLHADHANCGPMIQAMGVSDFISEVGYNDLSGSGAITAAQLVADHRTVRAAMRQKAGRSGLYIINTIKFPRPIIDAAKDAEMDLFHHLARTLVDEDDATILLNTRLLGERKHGWTRAAIVRSSADFLGDWSVGMGAIAAGKIVQWPGTEWQFTCREAHTAAADKAPVYQHPTNQFGHLRYWDGPNPFPHYDDSHPTRHARVKLAQMVAELMFRATGGSGWRKRDYVVKPYGRRICNA